MLSAEELILSKCGVGEDFLESLGLQGDQTSQPWIFIGRTDAEAEAPILWHFIWRADSLGKTLMLAKTEGRRRVWQRLRWLMVSFTQWVWVSVSSRRCWMTGKPGMLQSMGSQRVRHNWVTEQQQQTQMDFTRTKPPSPCFPLFINFHFLAAVQCPTFLLSLSQLFYSLIQSPLHKLKLNSFIKEPLPYCDGLLLIKACPYHFN